METILIAVGVLMIIATALPLLRKDEWWIRVLDFPRIQITIITVVVFAAYVVLRKNTGAAGNVFLAALFLCLLYQSYMMYPYTFLSRKQVQRSRNPSKESSFSLLFANVLIDNRNASHLRKIIREADPDIILAVEPDEWWSEQLRVFEETNPFTVYQPQDNAYGMILYSRLTLINPEVKFLVENDVPSIHTLVRLPSGQQVELHCLHPKPPVPDGDLKSTERDAELLIVGKEIKAKKVPAVVLGDLNDVAWSRTNYLFQDISGLLDPRIGRGFYNTFHAKYPFVRFPLDHFFHSHHFRLIDFRRLPYFGSDHFPVFIALSYEPSAEVQQEELQATRSEQKEAKEKIEKAK